MAKLKDFLRNINLLNLVLIATIILFANYAFFLMFFTKVKYLLPGITKSISDVKESFSEFSSPSSSDYMAISENNLFHPERRIPPEKKEEPTLPKPEFALLGTLITPDISIAYLEDQKAPRNTPGRGKRVTPLRKGDMMSGFILKDIQEDKIVMARGEERMTIPVHNPNRGKGPEVKTSAQPAASSPPKLPTKVEPPPKHRAPMTKAEEKLQDFFKRTKE